MTNWNSRELTLDLSFLEEGEYEAVIFQDGVNAGRQATDYKKVIKKISPHDNLTVELAPGGGWAARLEKMKK